MANVLIGFGNRANNIAFSGSYGSWLTTLPKDNMKSPILGKVARSTDATLTNTQFAFSTGAQPYDIRVISLCSHYLTTSALIRINAYGTDGTYTTSIFDSGWVSVWGNVFTSGLTGFDDTTPGGALPHGFSGATADIDKLWYFGHFNWNYIYYFTSMVNSRYWKIEINDTSHPAGYVQIGRLFIGGAWEPTCNFDFGASCGWDSNTSVQYSKGGSPYFDIKKPTRKAKFTLSHSSQIEAMQVIHTIAGQHGLDRELIYIQDRDQPQDIHRTAFLGRLKSLPEIEIANYGDNYRSSWEIVETL
jgi:hypothetical protein